VWVRGSAKFYKQITEKIALYPGCRNTSIDERLPDPQNFLKKCLLR
jgi:hypothetical protein